MNWFTNLFRDRADWRMCKLLQAEFVFSGPDGEREHTISYYLYENQYGERKFDLTDTKRGDRDVKDLAKNDIAYRLTIYMDTIKPWLAGRHDPEIPSYEQVPVNDFARALKGKK